MITTDQIKPLRAKLNESQEVFANRVGVSYRTVARWEADKESSIIRSKGATRIIQKLIDKFLED